MVKPKKIDLDCYRGQTWEQSLYITKNKQPVDLTGLTVKAEVRPAENSPTLTAAMVCTVDGPEGKITMAMPASVTAQILPNVYRYDLKVVDTNDKVQYYVKGKFIVEGHVTE